MEINKTLYAIRHKESGLFYLERDRDTYYDYDSRISQYDSMKHEFNKIIK